MTAYFDDKQEQAAKLRSLAEKVDALDEAGESNPDFRLFCDTIRDLDAAVVYDCAVCVEMPWCPPSIAEAVAACIFKHSQEGQPASRASRFWPVYNTCAEHAESIGQMIWDLHTIFHELAQLHMADFTDNPRYPLLRLASRNEERRDALTPQEEWSDVAKMMHEGETPV